MILLRDVVIDLALLALEPSAEVARYTREYFAVRIWSAPASLANYVCLGWLLGIGKTGHVGFNEPGSAAGSRTRMVTLDLITRRDAAAALAFVNTMLAPMATLVVWMLAHKLKRQNTKQLCNQRSNPKDSPPPKRPKRRNS